MKFNFFNTFHQILANDSITPTKGVYRQLEWFFIRLLNRFPRNEVISKSTLCVAKPNGPASLVHILGLYDYHNMNLIQSTLRDDPSLWFIDVGANIGVYTLLAAETGAKVLAIEPHLKTYASLLKNIEINGYKNIFAENCVATDQSSILKFSDFTEDAINKVQNDGTIIVNGVPIDTLVKKYKIGRFIMKIDTEGHDYQVVVGAINSLKICQLLIIEANGHNIQQLLTENKFHYGQYYNHNKRQFSAIPQPRKEDVVFLHMGIDNNQ